MAKTIFPEIRKDPTSGQWSVVAKKEKDEKGEKTERYLPPESDKYLKRPKLPLKSKECPFSQSFSGGRRQEKEPVFGLRWNERDEVEFVWDEKLEERKKLWYSDKWEVMIVEHDYAQVNRHISPYLFGHGSFMSLAGYGIHDMIIEDPTEEHKPLGVMPWKRTMLIFLAMLYRLKGDLGLKDSFPCFPKFNPDMVKPLSETDGIRHVSFFHNYLREAGASQEHPHSQIISSPIIPTEVAAELDYVRKRYDEPPGRCIYCQVIETEMNKRERVLFENESFVAIHPYAPVYPFEIWILPKGHSPSFEKIIPVDYSIEKPNPLEDLARIINDVVGRLYVSMNNPGYNLILKTTPIPRKGEREYFFHWHIRIETRGLYKPAGFEMGTGIYSCETPPEEAVEFLQKWGALTMDANTPGSLQWYIKNIRDLGNKSKGNDTFSEEEIQIVKEADHLLEIIPDRGKYIQRGLELRGEINEIIKKYPQLELSRYQQKYPDEPRQRIHALPREFEEIEGPHYRSDSSSYRWVLVPSKKRRVESKKHADEVKGWRKEEARDVYLARERENRKIQEIIGDIKKIDKNINEIDEKLVLSRDEHEKEKRKEDKEKKIKDRLEKEMQLRDLIPLSDDKNCCPFCKVGRDIYKNEPIFGLKEEDRQIEYIYKESWKDKWDVFLIKNYKPIFRTQDKEDKKLPILKGSGPFKQIEGKGICDVIVIGDGDSEKKGNYVDTVEFGTEIDKRTVKIHGSIGKMEEKFTKLALYALMVRLKLNQIKNLKIKTDPDKKVDAPICQLDEKIPGPAIKHFTIFSNYGRDSGARIAHPTWQIMSSPIIPTEIMRELAHSKAYYDENSCRCSFCDMIGAELDQAQQIIDKESSDKTKNILYPSRIIYPLYIEEPSDETFIVLAPFAARAPFELLILPFDHQSNMYEMTKKQLDKLAIVLHKTLEALSETLNDPPYSLVIKNAPIPPKGQDSVYAHYHWRIVIEPQRLAIPAGYEHLTGIWSNPTPPEEYAEVLRKKIAES